MFRGKQYFEVLVFFFAQIFEYCFSAVRLFSVSLRLKSLSWPKYGAQNEAYMSRSAEKWVRGLCFNELGVCG